MPEPVALLDPALLARVADLEWLARRIVDGVLSGPHRSPFHGHSAEFSQYRHYQPGDDLKYVDWKLFARTDRLYSKQYRETTNLAACVIVDASASMAFAGDGPLTKHRCAVVMTAVLSHLLARQGDHVGLLATSEGRDTYLAPRGGALHRRAIMAALASQRPGGAWDGPRLVREAASRLRGRGLLVVFSDFYDEDARTAAELRHAVRAGHEVAMFQVITPDELDLPYPGTSEFEDLETGATLVADASTIRQAYRDDMATFLERVRERALGDRIDYSLVRTSDPIEAVLRRYLLQQPRSDRSS